MAVRELNSQLATLLVISMFWIASERVQPRRVVKRACAAKLPFRYICVLDVALLLDGCVITAGREQEGGCFGRNSLGRGLQFRLVSRCAGPWLRGDEASAVARVAAGDYL